jgi:hypothetical protein
MRIFLALYLASVAFGVAAPSTPELQISRGVIQQFEDGPPLLKPDTVTAGETIHFSFILQGFTRKEDRVAVSYTAQAFDPSGVPLVAPLSGKNETTLGPKDKDWQPKLRGAFVLPSLLFPGEYKIHIQAKDEISGAPATLDLPFLVAGPAIPRSAALEVQSLKFYANEEAEKPLPVSAYRPGEEIHARFTITGYKHKDDGSIHVAYGIRLTDSAGNLLFENPQAALDDSTEFYPKPYIPAQLAFTLKEGTAKGEFTLEVTARDSIGDQQASAKGAFRLD